MKILHICNSYNDEMGYQDNILPIYHAKLGHEVTVIVPDIIPYYYNDRKRPIGECYKEGVKIKRIKTGGEFKGRFVIFKDLYNYIREEKPDYIFHHGLTMPSLLEVIKYRKRNNVFVAVDNHADRHISGRNRLWLLIYYQILWTIILKKCKPYIDIYFGVTPLRCDFMSDYLGINRSKIRLLPIGTDMDKIQISYDYIQMFQEKYKISANNILIVTGGKITKDKSVDKMIKAIKTIKNDNMKFIIFGKIIDETVQKLIDTDNRIIAIPWLTREQTLSLLSVCDIGVWTKHTTLLEDAVACGLPIITRYYGSTFHLIEDSGMFLYCESVDEIRDRIMFFINNHEILKKYKLNTQKLAKLLSYENIARESIEYFNDTEPKKIHNHFMKSYNVNKLLLES